MRLQGMIFALILSAIAGVTAQAQTSGCISRADMQDIARSFSQFKSLANADYCYDDSQTSHLLAGIMFMRRADFSPSMPKSTDDLFSGRFSSNWWNYFIGRINEFSVESNCQKGVIAFVYFFGNTMYVCPAALTANFTSLDLASVFMHEARHIDGFPHVTCSHGARQGIQGACDTRIGDGGSYAVTVETYAQLAKYATDLHPALRAYSKSASMIYAREAFENSVRINSTPKFLLMTNNGEFHEMTLDGGIHTNMIGHTPALGQIFMRASFMILYPDDKNLPAKFVFTHDEGETPQAAGDMAIEYNGLTPTQRADWKAVHLGAQWSAKLMRDRLAISCGFASTAPRDVSTGGETPVSTIFPGGYDRANSSANVVMESGKIFEFGCSGSSPFLRESSLHFDRQFRKMHKIGNDVVGLGMDGRLYSVQGTTSTLLNTPLNGQIHDLVPMESASFFE